MIICKTPLRVSFAGGGTDIDSYYRTSYGAVVSAAINKYIYVTVHDNFDHAVRVGYSKTEIAHHADELVHTRVRACLQMVGIDNGVEITTIGEVPAGTGMGSSSSLTVGLLNALYTYTGKRLSNEELYEKACKIEIDILKEPIGKQDQAAAAFGGLNYFRFNADDTTIQEAIRLPEADVSRMESKLLLFYTGMYHSAGEILREQRKTTQDNLALMDEMREQADRLRNVMKRDGFTPVFGEILREDWERKKQLASGISNQKVNELYERGIRAGASGGKLLGAGGGGFLLFYCDEWKQDDLRTALGLKVLDFRIAKYGSRIVYFD